MPSVTTSENVPAIVGYAMFAGRPMPIYANRADSLRRAAQVTVRAYRQAK